MAGGGTLFPIIAGEFIIFIIFQMHIQISQPFPEFQIMNTLLCSCLSSVNILQIDRIYFPFIYNLLEIEFF